MLTVDDIRGVYVLPPTPCREDGLGWDLEDSVDHDEVARMIDLLVQPGVTGIGLFGSTGEGSTLLVEEKIAAAATAVEAAAGRVQIFGGATALGTREVVRQMRLLRDVGVDGALVGLPLWQTPTVENMIRFYSDLSEAVPDLPIMIYSNSWFFKTDFPPALWAGLIKTAPTVIASKNAHGFAHFEQELEAVEGKINLIPGEFAVFEAYRRNPSSVTAMWSTQAALGPEPMVALMAAIDAGDAPLVEEIIADFKKVPPYAPPGAMANRDLYDDFARYNVQVGKYRLNASGVIKAGPLRSPYVDLPDEWKRQAEMEIAGFAALREKYSHARQRGT
jgi:dihydrodipicolinate synthase/N-acetylneuraminate lyase